MARRTISFDGVSLQTSYIVSREFNHEAIDNREANYQRLGARDGSKLVSVTFGVKRIEIEGTLKGDSIDDLEARQDQLKALFNKRERNLDIQYASGTRRYKASIESIKIDRRYYNIVFCPFTITFICANPPFGTTLDTSTAQFNTIAANGTGTYSGTATFTGTYRPFPVVKLTINSASNLSRIEFRNKNTNSKISIQRIFSAADVILIDTENINITVNGVNTDYDGVLPDFVQGGNDFAVHFYGNSYNASLKVIYRPLYY